MSHLLVEKRAVMTAVIMTSQLQEFQTRLSEPVDQKTLFFQKDTNERKLETQKG